MGDVERAIKKLPSIAATIVGWLVLETICSFFVSLSLFFSILTGLFVTLLIGEDSASISMAGQFLSCIVVAVLAVLASMPASTALARFTLRNYPIDLGLSKSEQHRRVLKGILLGIVIFFSLIVLKLDFKTLTQIPVDKKLFFLWLQNFCLVVANTSMLVGAFWITIIVQIRHSHLIAQPYLLFLRRFNSFSDRVLMGEILRSTPPGFHPTFIVSPENKAANWDFWVWAFSGLRFRHPLRDIPLYLRVKDLSWVRIIASLIKNARCVVIEETEYSLSMEIEHKLVMNIATPDRVVCLIEDRLHTEDPDTNNSNSYPQREALPAKVKNDPTDGAIMIPQEDEAGFQVIYPSFILYFSSQPTMEEKQAPDANHSNPAPQGEALPAKVKNDGTAEAIMIPQEDGAGFQVISGSRNRRDSLKWNSVRYKKSYWTAIPGILLRISLIIVAGYSLDIALNPLFLLPSFASDTDPVIPNWIPLMLYSIPFLIRSGINKEYRRIVRQAIESATKDSTNISKLI
jgi:hypothetical protein